MRKDGGPAEHADPQNAVRVAASGPIYVRGEIDLVCAGETTKETRLALCRCGKSANKPYCDNAHIRSGFEDDGRGAQKPVAESIPEGKVVVTPRANGSILFEGPVEVQSSDGRILFRGEKVSLCRCGHSQSKPFCDGSHKTSGFEAP
jgi:CDGSH-type Zn-finger protein